MVRIYSIVIVFTEYIQFLLFLQNIFNCYCFYRIYSIVIVFTEFIQLLLFLQNIFNANNFEQVGGVFFSGVSIPESEEEEEERQGNDRKLELGKADIFFLL